MTRSPRAPTREQKRPRRRWLKPVVFLACLVPLGLVAWSVAAATEPVEALEDGTGLWTLRFLALTLAVTPARRLLGFNGLIAYRRMLGLFVFFYACVHVLAYSLFDMSFDLGEIVKDVAEHLWITLGMAAFLMLVPLAVTSTKKMVKRLGGRRWVMLHRLVYLVAVAGTLHFFWSVKKDHTEPLVYAAVFATLLALRAWVAFAPGTRARALRDAERRATDAARPEGTSGRASAA